jgi:hypothetical protein
MCPAVRCGEVRIGKVGAAAHHSAADTPDQGRTGS